MNKSGSIKHGYAKRGEKKSKEYQAWQRMINRCRYPTDPRYNLYGGRGITVCQRWAKSFTDFLGDMGFAPSPKHSIDRINNNGNYEPTNCRWATNTQQSRNRSNNTMILHNNENKTISEWAEITGLSSQRICSRIKRGWTPEKAVSTPLRPTGREKINNMPVSKSKEKYIYADKRSNSYAIVINRKYIKSSPDIAEAIRIRDEYLNDSR